MNAPRQSGFSLIELMVTLAIVAVLASVAMPSIREGLARMRVKGAAASLVDSVTAARSLALDTTAPSELRPVVAVTNANWNSVQNDNVVVTATNVAGVADKSLIQAGKASWYVAVTPPGSTTTLVRNITPIPDSVIIRVFPAAAIGNIQFDFSGRRSDAMGRLQFTVCAPNTNFTQLVIVQPSGQVSTEIPAGVVAC